MKNQYFVLIVLVLTSFSAFSYRFEVGEFYVGGGFGANINVARYEVAGKMTPRAEVPLLVNLDYVFDHNFNFFGSFVPQFGSGSVNFLFRAGAKYRINFADAPYVAYVSLALTPSFLLPTSSEPTHFNLGLSPGVGLNYFIMSKFMVGAHVHFNPSVAFVDGDKKFEFSVMPFFDVSLRV